ncbi:MAG: hypothetical protein KBT11_06765 [Treponema sp.]|nr:hypothetical protein [Candidatus Treponema equifaecale]
MKKYLAGFAAFFLSASLFAADLSFRFTPGMFMPSKDYDSGFGATAQADLDLFGFLTVGVEGLFNSNTPTGLNDSLNIFGGGIGLGAYYYPLSRLYLGVGGSYGIYSFSTKMENESKSASDLYWRGYGELGFRFNPTVSVNAVGGYNTFQVSGSDNLLDGVFAGLSLKLSVSTSKKSSGGFSVSLKQEDAAYPLYMNVYKKFPIGNLTIRNTEGADVQDVRVSFRAGKYTSSAYESAKFSKIKKYKSVELPLLADFSTEILKFSENGKILGEVVIDYNFLGTKKQSVHSVVVDVYNRNAFMWDDATAIASFISPDTPEILEFAKYVAGIARNDFRTGINRNIEIAANMAEAIRLAKIEYSQDKITPYVEFHNGSEMDSIQYPLQSMNMVSGDYDELGILLASCLESVGVGTGYIPFDDDFIVLVNLDIRPSSAENNFADISGIIVDEDAAYFGISMKYINSGFTAARNEAFKTIKKALSSEDGSLEIYDTHIAWEYYAPAIFTGSSGLFVRPGQSAIEKAGKQAVNDYINSEIEGVIRNARKSGDSNKIGLSLVRVGRYAEAKAEFQKSNSVQAMNNLANVYLLEKNYPAAKAQFEKVLAKEPENKTALKGLEKAKAF